MNIRELEYLVALDDLRHFRKAADQCCVSQPTLSAQVKKLEEELGIQLVERSQRRVMLTPVGREVVLHARSVLREVSNIQQIPARHLDPMSGRLSIGVIPTLAPYLLPRIIGPIKQAWPQLELKLVEAMTMPLLSRVLDGECDLLILALPLPAQQHFMSLESIALFPEPFYLAVPEHHALAGRRSITMAEIEGQSMSLLEDGHCLRDQALDVCQAAGSMENADLRATSLETLRYMVAAGETMTLMPRLALQESADLSKGISYIPFRNPQPQREIGLAFRGSSARLPCFRKLARLIKEEVRPALARPQA